MQQEVGGGKVQLAGAGAGRGETADVPAGGRREAEEVPACGAVEIQQHEEEEMEPESGAGTGVQG